MGLKSGLCAGKFKFFHTRPGKPFLSLWLVLYDAAFRLDCTQAETKPWHTDQMCTEVFGQVVHSVFHSVVPEWIFVKTMTSLAPPGCCVAPCGHEWNTKQLNATMKKLLLTQWEQDTWSWICTSLLPAITSWLRRNQTRGWTLCPLLSRWRPEIGHIHTTNTLLLDLPVGRHREVCAMKA